MGVLRKIQAGVEATPGTAVPADTMIITGDYPSIVPDHKPVFIKEETGLRVDGQRAISYTKLVKNTIRIPHAYYQVLPLLFSIATKGGVTPAEQTTSQNDMLWDHTPALGAANGQQSITLELGDETAAVEIEYVMISRIKASFQIPQDGGEAPMAIEFDYFGRQNTDTTFTGGLSLPSQEMINGKLCRIYRDTSWAGVGGTEKTGLIRAVDIEIMTGLEPASHGGVNKYFDTNIDGNFRINAALTVSQNSEAEAIRTLFNTDPQALSVLRFDISGGQIGTGVNHNLKIDMGVEYEASIPISSIDRDNSLTSIVAKGVYDPTGAKLFQLSAITDVAAI